VSLVRLGDRNRRDDRCHLLDRHSPYLPSCWAIALVTSGGSEQCDSRAEMFCLPTGRSERGFIRAPGPHPGSGRPVTSGALGDGNRRDSHRCLLDGHSPTSLRAWPSCPSHERELQTKRFDRGRFCLQSNRSWDETNRMLNSVRSFRTRRRN
jgi:hypothetical protein